MTIPAPYTPLEVKIPHLKVPENRLMYAFAWYQKQNDHPNNFACYSYWLERCMNDGSDY